MMKRILTLTLLCGLLSAGPALAIKAKSNQKKDTGKAATTARVTGRKHTTAGSRRKSQEGLLKKLRDQKSGQKTIRKKDVFIDRNNDGVDDRVSAKTHKKKPATARPSGTTAPKPKPAVTGSVKRVKKKHANRSSRSKRDPR